LDESPPYGGDLMLSLGLRGLQCGSGPKLMSGCLNTDMVHLSSRDGTGETEMGRLARLNGDLYYLEHDATEPFPVEDESFDWVYNEHFIEHLFPGDAIVWLREVRRILRPGGHLRISTPDMRKYMNGYADPDKAFFKQHHERMAPHLQNFLVDPEDESIPPQRRNVSRRYFPGDEEVPIRPAFMVNQIFQLWGHRWVYDFDELRHVAERAGFDPALVVERSFREGRKPDVAALDLEHRNDESIYVEIQR
jgi:SAM-dependent methyltransferase